ncbi:desulfoferrodoxin family protein [Methylocucumis oryzae]|uniref:Desulfoferrodoxin ferrous iron-binding domain-containing protein n=1 Tax=Methylocucumis oryzae TaxID=1632867 RepID=A0A0F3IGL0_9GAMM|nr:desulfoferrodoxin family protein [Methylocucumis oryzae]KJV05940.1 hypothetical protein VZ94_14615 [Methylocucumis oryzae]
MKRRDFIRAGITGLTTSLVLPNALAATGVLPPTLGDLYYTEAAQGRWSGKAATHLPKIELSKQNTQTLVKVVTPHEMKGYEHYIVKHVLLDSAYKFVAEHMFNPIEDKVALSTFTLDNYSGAIYVLSLCNKHDLWLATAEV